jgi:hypothetical protein
MVYGFVSLGSMDHGGGGGRGGDGDDVLGVQGPGSFLVVAGAGGGLGAGVWWPRKECQTGRSVDGECQRRLEAGQGRAEQSVALQLGRIDRRSTVEESELEQPYVQCSAGRDGRARSEWRGQRGKLAA